MRSALWWLLLAVLFLAGLIAQRGVLVAFAAILALAGGASELWARYGLASVTYRRRLGSAERLGSAGRPDSAQLAFGEETTLTLELTNAKPLPLAWLLVRDRYPKRLPLLTGDEVTRLWQGRGWLHSLVALRWYERISLTHRLRGAERGYHIFGPAELASGDMFGFQQRRRAEEQQDVLIVHPPVVPREALGLPADRPLGEWLARRRVIEDPLRFATVREYAPGDNPRHIHWRASAHTGALQSKVFDASDTRSLILALDVQTAEYAYDLVPAYLELIVAAAATLAVEALGERFMVGLYANALARDGQGWTTVRPGRHPQQENQLLCTLAGVDALRGMRFAAMLYALRPQLPYGSTVVAISALASDDLYEALGALEEAGHQALLLTVGEEPPEVPEGLRWVHLGGHDAWQQVLQCAETPGAAL